MSTPPDIQAALDSFCKRLYEVVGAQLVSVVLYGGLARGEYIPDKSDINLMIVLKASTIKILDEMAPAVDQARRDWNVSVMVVTEEDVPDAAEVFSTKFLDLLRHHHVLWGKDVLNALTISPERLRRQCARELVNLKLRLRQYYLYRRRKPEQIESTLEGIVAPLLTILGVLIELKTGEKFPTKAAVAAGVGKIGLKAEVLSRILALKKDEIEPGTEELKQLYAELMHTVEQAAHVAHG